MFCVCFVRVPFLFRPHSDPGVTNSNSPQDNSSQVIPHCGLQLNENIQFQSQYGCSILLECGSGGRANLATALAVWRIALPRRELDCSFAGMLQASSSNILSYLLQSVGKMRLATLAITVRSRPSLSCGLVSYKGLGVVEGAARHSYCHTNGSYEV